MEFLGEYLKKAREDRNLSIEEVAESTKIKGCYLRAIEEDRFESLPSPFYIRSFLRLYASFLGFDPEDVLKWLQRDQEDLTVKPPDVPSSFVPRKRKHRPSTFFLFVFGLLSAAAIVYIVSSVFSKQVPSLAFLRPAITSSPVHFLTAQEETEVVFPHAKQEEFLEKEEASVEEMTGSDSRAYAVLEAAFGRRIETVQNRPRLRGVSTEFECNQRVYFLTRIRTPLSGKISHVWLWEGKEIQTIDMEVEAPVWSIYSYVTLRPHQTGHWRVEVRDSSTVLFGQTFRVVESDLVT
jgi:transcriptional regulator with XRE-family HTH domain